jgi:hypothetical protein
MKLLELPVKTTYTNLIRKHYEENTDLTTKKVNGYENGMYITIANKGLNFTPNIGNESYFRDVYISIITALKGKDYKISKKEVKQLNGDFIRNRLNLPTRQNVLGLINKKIPILICGTHNYELDDPRSGGREYCHTHYILYNIHHYLPDTPMERMNIIGKIEGHLSRHISKRKRKRMPRDIVIKSVKDEISPLQFYDYLHNPFIYPEQKKTPLINYIAHNSHLPSIQYPLTTIYSTQPL